MATALLICDGPAFDIEFFHHPGHSGCTVSDSRLSIFCFEECKMLNRVNSSFHRPEFSLKGPLGYPIVAALLLTAAGAWAFAYFGYDPVWALVLIIIGILIPLALRRWPVEILACLLFVGNFKNTPARGISLTDPTMLLLFLSGAAFALDFLFVVSGTTRWSLRGLLSGQTAAIGVFLAFVAVIALSALYSGAPDVGYPKIERILVFNVFVFLAPILLFKEPQDVQRVLTAVVLLALALVVKEITRADNPSQKVIAGEADVTYIGDGMLFATAILISLFQKVWPWRWMRWGTLAALTVGLMASAARGPVLALFVTVALSALLVRNRQTASRMKLIAGAAAILIIAVAAYQWFENKPGMQQRLESKQSELIAFLNGSKMSAGTIEQRLSFYNSALDAFVAHPVLGLGAGGWSTFYSMNRVPTFPHSFVLEVAAEQGLVGLLLLTVLLGLLFRRAKALAWQPQFAFLFPVLLFGVIINLFTGDLEDRSMWFWSGTVLAGARMVMEAHWQRTSEALHEFHDPGYLATHAHESY
jgi:O-antigen ligase/polysaccharide polymerase Wzy-like membrane protein